MASLSFNYMSVLDINLLPMRNQLLSLCVFLIFLLANVIGTQMILVSGQCQSDQQSSLLQIKKSLIFNSSLPVNLLRWNQSTDCCKWGGVDCNEAGHIIGLNLSNKSISGGIENATSLFGLQSLQSLNLAFNLFDGTQIPPSLSNLTQLVYLDLSSNSFGGSIPSFHMSKSLTYLDLSNNVLTGEISSFGWEQLPNLSYVDLSYNSLNGSIPTSLIQHPSLQKLDLANNQFEGQLLEFSDASSSALETLSLSGNRLEGSIPMSIFELKHLKVLSLDSNNFSGTVQLNKIPRSSNLTDIHLSHNNLTAVNASGIKSFFPPLTALRLAGCKLSTIPYLNAGILELDLSDNQISGEVPNWIWEIVIIHLNLSHNFLEGLQEPYSVPGFFVLDLHSNRLQGKLPQLPPHGFHMDFSSNNFNSSIPVDIGDFLSGASFFSLSNNTLTGVIPESLCNAIHLEVLDLSSNNLNGTLPPCLINWSNTLILTVLNLRRNNLTGIIPDAFVENCRLQTLSLNGNQLEGTLPKSLANCTKLEVLDLGNNQISGTFPCWLENVSSLRVLVLRSNKFYGNIGCPKNNISWPMLQIIDLASNNFNGSLPRHFLKSWEAMMNNEAEAQSNLKYLHYEVTDGYTLRYYQDSTTVTSKGLVMELVKVLTLFTSIDFSSNKFQGSIPEEIGLFRSLYALNLSHNAFTGSIPLSIGNMRQLESLDLSMNDLTGAIPIQLASLNFLSFLNVSYNDLEGRIPSSTQLQSFSPTSFEGNGKLCGLPLTNNCTNSSALVPPRSVSSNEINWKFIAMAVGFAISYGVVVAPLIFSKRVNKWYDDRINKYKVKFGM